MEQYLRVGVITTTHGLKGELKIYPTVDDPKRFLDLKGVLLRLNKKERALEVEKVRFFKQMVIVKFKGLDRIEDVEAFRRGELYVSRENAVPLAEGEYYIGDLIDMEVRTTDGEVLGTLTDVMETGANDVYVVQSKKYGEILIPAIKQCIITVDVESARMVVDLLPGLLPEQ